MFYLTLVLLFCNRRGKWAWTSTSWVRGRRNANRGYLRWCLCFSTGWFHPSCKSPTKFCPFLEAFKWMVKFLCNSQGIRAVTGPMGCLLVVTVLINKLRWAMDSNSQCVWLIIVFWQNYTGDRLNFGLAAELAKTEGFKVEVTVCLLL